MKNGFYRRAALTAGLLLILFAGLLSPADGGGKMEPAETEPAGMETAGRKTVGRETAETETSEMKTSRQADSVVSPQTHLTEAQTLLLDKLLSLMESGELDRAASVMSESEEALRELILVTFGGHRQLYSEEGISGELEGRGIVLKSPSVIFYGNFAEGVPEGQVTALQEIVLEVPRYDYSIGVWSGGRMNGDGVTGYFYYKGTGELDGRKTERAGTFIDDRLDGAFRYTSIDRDGDSTTFIIRAENGVTILDEHWKYEAKKGEYHLPAQGEETHLYVLKADLAEEVLWKNRIVWE